MPSDSASGLTPEPLPANDACSFFDGDRLVHFDIGEPLHLLSRGPFHFDQINHLAARQTKVQTKITLRHHTGAAVDLVRLCVRAGHNAHSASDSRTVAL